MKKSGILNAQLIRCIAELGHKDLFMIGDAGMPIPKGVEIVDLVVCGGDGCSAGGDRSGSLHHCK